VGTGRLGEAKWLFVATLSLMPIFLTKLVGDVPTQQVGLLPSVSACNSLWFKDEGGLRFSGDFAS
jgi:hypothetical protein